MNQEPEYITDGIEILHRRYFEGHPDHLASLEDIRANDHVSHDLFTLREKAGLTQEQLAEKAGTTAEIVDRIELNDFEEFSVEFMQQYARVLGKRLEVRIVESEVIAQQKEIKDQPAA